MSPSTDTSTAAETPPNQRPDPPALRDGPDDVFALVSGLYVAAVVVPVALAWLLGTVSGAGTLFLVALGGGTVVLTGVALAVRRVSGLDYRLGARRGRWWLVFAPLAVVVVAGGSRAVATAGNVEESTLLFGLVALAGGVLLGSVLAMMARTRYARAVEEGVETLAEWRAAWPPGRRRLPKVTGALTAIAGAGAFAFGFVAPESPVRALGHLLLPVGIVLFMFGHNPRTYRANAAGLVRQMPANRELYEWDRFEGYTVAADAIVIHFRAPWRFPVICDRDALDDEEHVLDTLSESLPRLPAR